MRRLALPLVFALVAPAGLLAQNTDYRVAVIAAQPARYEPVGCGIKDGHFKVRSGATYLSTATRNETNRERLLADANRVLTEAIRDNGQANNPTAWYYLGRVNLFQGDVIGADTAFARAESLAPECHEEIMGFRRASGQALLEPAGLLLQANQSDSALMIYRLAARINPSSASTLVGVGGLFEAQGMTDSAIVYFRKASALGGNDRSTGMARQRLAAIYAVAGQPDSAAVYYDAVIRDAEAAGEVDARNSATLSLAGVYYNAGRYAEAVPLLRRYVEWRPDVASARQYLASAYREMGQVDSADAVLRNQPGGGAAMAGPDTTSANYFINRGAAHYQANEHAKAAEDFEHALEREPTNRLALRNLAATYYTLKNAQKLADVAGRLVALEPLSESARRLQIQGYIWINDRAKLESLSDALDAMRIKLEDVKFQKTASGATLTGTATGRAARLPNGPLAPAPVTLVFEFLDASGGVVTSVEQTVPALQPDLPAPVTVNASGSGIVDWRYKAK